MDALLNIRLRNVVTCAALALAAAAAIAVGPNPREFARTHGGVVRLSIATGNTGGVYYPYGGALAKVIFDYSGVNTTRWLRVFSYTRSVILSLLAIAAGAVFALPLAIEYARSGLQLSGAVPEGHLAVVGLMLVIGGAMTFTFTLALHAVAANVGHR